MLTYPVRFEHDDNGTMLITSPAFPEVTTFADNTRDGVHQVQQAIEEAIAARIDAGGQIPTSMTLQSALALEDPCAPVRISALSSIKALLYVELQRSGITRAELQRRLDWNRESVDRLFRLDHGSKLEQLEAAFAALGREIVLDVRETKHAA